MANKWLLILIMISLTSFASNPSRQSIPWGNSVKQLKSSGLSLQKVDAIGRLSYFSATQLTFPFVPAERYILTVDKDYKLQKIIAIIPTFSDNDGEIGKQRFAIIKTDLIKLYGKPVLELETVRTKNNFYQCLNNAFCGQWSAIFEPYGNQSILLEIKSQEYGKGYIKLTYEGPNWIDAVFENQSLISSEYDKAL